MCWRLTVVRRWLLVLLVLHVLVRVWTIAYFAPTIIAFQSVPVSSAVDPLLAQKAAQWRHLNIVRVLIFLAVNLAMLSPIRQVHRMLVAATFATRDLGDP